MGLIIIELPWPPEELSPNKNVHRMAHYRVKKSAKIAAWGFTKAVMATMGLRHGQMQGPVDVHIVFHPAMDRARDVDNFQARMKAPLDGIALALGINDSLFHPVTSFGEKRTPACVVVTLTPTLIDVPVIGVIS